ncbi:MAG: YkvA family protein [Bacteroidota bacterium]
MVLTPIVYLLLPTDLIPDFLLGPGFIDDILVFLALFGKVRRHLEQYILKHSPKNEKKPETHIN